MNTFTELYSRIINDALKTGQRPANISDYDSFHLDCLLHPEKYPVILKTKECRCSSGNQPDCAKSCMFNAIIKNENGDYEINSERCVGCASCIDACKSQNLTSSRDILPALYAVRNSEVPVYALIAPSFLGQFHHDTTPGKLRSAFKKIGFHGMIEVALFADILTLKEALEFEKNINKESDFQLTSCCCPIWIAMIRKIYSELISHLPASVSPMIAAGRAVKHMYPDSITVFISPCIAKKAEAREPDLIGAIDYVLTYQEMNDIFRFAGMNPNEENDDGKEHSSRAGRIYARSGGVSEAVQNTVKRINPNRKISVQSSISDGIQNCREVIAGITDGKLKANFYEGMGCNGGCIGGPKVIIDRGLAKRYVDSYGEEAAYSTPIDNPYVIELLHRLGFDTIESLLNDSKLFTRKL